MTAVGELVLVLGLLVSAHCEVRARDPEVEEDEEELGGRGGGGGGGVEGLHPGPTETPPLEERGNYPARTGNWCPYVHRRVVTTAVVCGTEKYTIKFQSLCPSGKPDCQLVMYKLSTRPVYKQKQQVSTALLWRCCRGHGGPNCEDTVSEAPQDSGGSDAVRTELHAPGMQQRLQLQRGDPNREQNDHQPPDHTGYQDNQQNATHPDLEPNHGHYPRHTSHQSTETHDLHQHHQQNQHHNQQHQNQHLPGVDEVDAAPLPYPDAPAALPVPHMMALVMSQLQPVLEGFNHSLEHLSRMVGDLAQDVAQLKSSQLQVGPRDRPELQVGPPDRPELQTGPQDRPELDDAAEERLEAKLEEALEQVQEVRGQLESQRTDMENRLHSQHVMLHYNLTSFKTDIDMKLKRHQKMLQISLQAMNATLTELKLDQDQHQDQDQDQDQDPEEDQPPPLPSDTSALWTAVERLDNMVVNNTVKVDGLMEDMDVTSGDVQQLQRDLKDLEKSINQTARTSQVQFMETGLEVEAAREVVMTQVGAMATNVSRHSKQLHDMDDDMTYLWNVFHNSTAECDCKGLKAAVARLERGVANVTELANENRLALDEDGEVGAGQWGGDWEPAVEALQRELQQVKESLSSEQTRTRTLDRSLAQLSSSLTVALAEQAGLKEADRRLLEEMRHLSASFSSLLKDAIRHSDVLELLLGEEVLEFLEWPVQDQEAHSIPALKEQLRLLQEEQRGHERSISSLQGSRTGGEEEVPSADQPSSSSSSSSWPPPSMRRSSDGAQARERQQLLRPDHRGDGGDLWNLEKKVEELRLKVLRLEEKPRNTTTEREAQPGGVEAKLQAEVTWLKRGLEEHLRVFKNVFSNADVLLGSDASLELDKVWQLVRSREGKKERKRGGGGGGGGGDHRSRREAAGLPGLSGASLLLLAGSPLSVSDTIVFEASLNRARCYSDSGTFTAPLSGIYLFVLTLDLRPGPAHVVLGRGGGAPGTLHRLEVMEAGPVTGVGLLPLSGGEEVRLKLKSGEWAESEDNVFAVLLLHRTT